MEFFKNLSKLGIGEIDLKVKTAEDGSMTVIVPIITKAANDPALKSLKPFYITNTPEVIDEKFFNSISEPLKKATSFVENIAQAEARIEEQKKQTRIEKEKRKEEKDLVDNIKKILDKKDFDADADTKKVRKAISVLQEKFPEHNYITKAKAELLKLTTPENSLF